MDKYKPPQLYCADCGDKMRSKKIGIEKVDDRFNFHRGYDLLTGKRMWAYKYVCPNKKWWSPFMHQTQYTSEHFL